MARLKKYLVPLTPCVLSLVSEGIDPRLVTKPALMEVDEVPPKAKDFIMDVPASTLIPDGVPDVVWQTVLTIESMGLEIYKFNQGRDNTGISCEEICYKGHSDFYGVLTIWRPGQGDRHYLSCHIRYKGKKKQFIDFPWEVSANIPGLLQLLRFYYSAVLPRVAHLGWKEAERQINAMRARNIGRMLGEGQDERDYILSFPDNYKQLNPIERELDALGFKQTANRSHWKQVINDHEIIVGLTNDFNRSWFLQVTHIPTQDMEEMLYFRDIGGRLEELMKSTRWWLAWARRPRNRREYQTEGAKDFIMAQPPMAFIVCDRANDAFVTKNGDGHFVWSIGAGQEDAAFRFENEARAKAVANDINRYGRWGLTARIESAPDRAVAEGASSPRFSTLKKHRQSLDDAERKEAGDAPVWKSVVDGATWYVSNTHRCFQAKKSLSAAVRAYHEVVEPSG